MATLYDVLGVEPSVDQDGLRAAFKRRVLEAHPDKGGCKEDFRRVMEAFETLYNADRRAQYDQSRAAAQAGGWDPAAQGRRLRRKQPCQERRRDLHCRVHLWLSQGQAQPPGMTVGFVTELTGLIGFLKPRRRRKILAQLSKDVRAAVREHLLERRRARLPDVPGEQPLADSLDGEGSSGPSAAQCDSSTMRARFGKMAFRVAEEGKKNGYISHWYNAYVATVRMVPGIQARTQTWRTLPDAVDAHCLLLAVQASVQAAWQAGAVPPAPGKIKAAVLEALAAVPQEEPLKLRFRFLTSFWGMHLEGPWIDDIEAAMQQKISLRDAKACTPSIPGSPLDKLDAQFQQVQRLWESITGRRLPAVALAAFEKHRAAEAQKWREYQEDAGQDAQRQESLLLRRIGILLHQNDKACHKAMVAQRREERRKRKLAEMEAERRELLHFVPRPESVTQGPLQRLVR